jgi:hypothetical protein
VREDQADGLLESVVQIMIDTGQTSMLDRCRHRPSLGIASANGSTSLRISVPHVVVPSGTGNLRNHFTDVIIKLRCVSQLLSTGYRQVFKETLLSCKHNRIAA